MRLAFVACTEPGYLEDQSLVLFRSIRRWAGRHSRARIASVQPRHTPSLRPSTRRALEDLDVEHHAIPLNTEFDRDPMANKIFAAAWMESHSDEDIVIFLDSDAFVLGEPSDLELEAGFSAAVRPVFSKGAGTSGPGDPHHDFWLSVWRVCGANPPPLVRTVAGGELIHAYWNGGLVACRRGEGLFQRWLENFRALSEANLTPPGGKLGRHLEQTALAGTLARVASRVKALDWRYNYPLQRRPRLPEPMRSADLDQLVHVHYFKGFGDPELLESVTPRLDRHSERFRWLQQMPLDRLSSPERRARHRIRRLKARCAEAERIAREAAETARDAQRRADRAESRLAALESSRWFRICRAAGLVRSWDARATARRDRIR